MGHRNPRNQVGTRGQKKKLSLTQVYAIKAKPNHSTHSLKAPCTLRRPLPSTGLEPSLNSHSSPELLVFRIVNVVRNRSQEVEHDGHERCSDRETSGDAAEAERVEIGAVEVMEKEEGDKSEGFGVGGVGAVFTPVVHV
ncbi:hypothetical protein PanWU01x14_324810, partial [Parasponia andersonii]